MEGQIDHRSAKAVTDIDLHSPDDSLTQGETASVAELWQAAVFGVPCSYVSAAVRACEKSVEVASWA
jgi:hypothetical protein